MKRNHQHLATIKKIETCFIWTIVQMLDVITSFNCNCYSPMMVVVWICFIHLSPLRGRWTQSGHTVPLLGQRITCIPTIDISRSDVTPALSRASLRCDVTFSQPSTQCSSETTDVITSKNALINLHKVWKILATCNNKWIKTSIVTNDLQVSNMYSGQTGVYGRNIG
jgi:hypothetical protein